jgi:hypothetical protein
VRKSIKIRGFKVRRFNEMRIVRKSGKQRTHAGGFVYKKGNSLYEQIPKGLEDQPNGRPMWVPGQETAPTYWCMLSYSYRVSMK